MAGYEDHTVNVNKAVEVLDDLMTIDDKDTCITCERPDIILTLTPNMIQS